MSIPDIASLLAELEAAVLDLRSLQYAQGKQCGPLEPRPYSNLAPIPASSLVILGYQIILTFADEVSRLHVCSALGLTPSRVGRDFLGELVILGVRGTANRPGKSARIPDGQYRSSCFSR